MLGSIGSRGGGVGSIAGEQLRQCFGFGIRAMGLDATTKRDRKRDRTQAGRRESRDAKVNRFMKEHIYGKLLVSTIEEKRVDCDQAAPVL